MGYFNNIDIDQYQDYLLHVWNVDENGGDTIFNGLGDVDFVDGGVGSIGASGINGNCYTVNSQGAEVLEDGTMDVASGESMVLSIWFKSTTSTRSYLTSFGFGDNAGFDIQDVSNRIRFNLYDGTQGSFPSVTNAAWFDDEWHHVVGVYDANNKTAYVYVDGSSNTANVQNNSIASSWDLTGSYYFGRRRQNNELDGSVDELYVWKSASLDLSNQTNREDFVNALYNSGDGRFADTKTLSFTFPKFDDVTIDKYGDRMTHAWTMETTGTRKDSVGTLDLTESGNVLSASGINGQSADFERDNSECLEGAAMAVPDPGTNWVASLWLKQETNNSQYVFSQYTGGGSDAITLAIVTTGGGQINLAISGSGVLTVSTASGSVLAGNWYHVVMAKQGSTVYLYLDGDLKDSGTLSGTAQIPTFFRIGCRNFGSGNEGFFDGVVDEVYTWDDIFFGEIARLDDFASALYASGTGKFLSTKALTPFTVTPSSGTTSDTFTASASITNAEHFKYNFDFLPQYNNLIEWWSFQNATSGNDVVGDKAGIIAEDNNTVAIVSGGIVGSAASFIRANSERYEIPKASYDFATLWATRSWTINVWFKTTSTVQHFMFSSTSNGPTHGVDIYLSDAATGRISVRLYDSDTAPGSFDYTDASHLDGEWHMLTVTCDGSTSKLYVDGDFKSQDTTVTGIGNPNQLLSIGAAYQTGPTNHFDGDLDEPAIWSSPLIATEITSLYKEGLGKSITQLVWTPETSSNTYEQTFSTFGTFSTAVSAANNDYTDILIEAGTVLEVDAGIPNTNFTFSPTSAVVDENINFTAPNNVDNGILFPSYTWDFGDGNVFLGPSGPSYPTAHTDTYVKSTGEASANFKPYFATDPTLLLTGGDSNNQWLGSSSTNQRLNVDLGSAKQIVKLLINNAHESGVSTNRGAKNFVLQGSNDNSSFTTTTYATDTGWTDIATLQAPQHIGSDVADEQELTFTNANSYRYYSLKISDNWGEGNFLGIRHVEFIAEDKAVEKTNVYSTPGTYTVCMTATNATETATASGCQSVTVLAPTANFTFDPIAPIVDESVNFTAVDNFATSGTTYKWDFGDGNLGTGSTDSNNYDTTGTFTVCLTATNASQTFSATACNDVLVLAPTSSFSVTPLGEIDIDELLTFTAIDNLLNSKYRWDFGDGTFTNFSTGGIETHSYGATGTYTASLTACNLTESFCTTSSQDLDVTFAFPDSSFTIIPSSDQRTTQKIIFDLTSTYGTIFDWDFGDGTITKDTSGDINHTYNENDFGATTVSLTSWNSDKSEFEIEQLGMTLTGPNPTATISVTPTSGLSNTQSFNADFSLSILSHDKYVDWNDETSTNFTTGNNDAHIYALDEFGTRTVTVTAWNIDNTQFSTDTQNISVINASPTATLVVPTTGFIGIPDLYDASGSSSNVSQFNFDFDNGETVTTSSDFTNYAYPLPGTYTVTLTATNLDSTAIDVVTGSIVVDAPPSPIGSFIIEPDFSDNKDDLNLFETITFNASASLYTGNYIWDFGDGNGINTVNPSTTHSYSTTGTFTTILSATNFDLEGIKAFVDIVSSNLTITDFIPSGTLDVLPPILDAFTEIASATFNGTINTIEPNSLIFDWGDGSALELDKGPNATRTHIYTTTGVKTVNVTAWNRDKTDFIVKSDNATVTNRPPISAFTVLPTSDIKTSSFDFTNTSQFTDSFIFDWGDGTLETTSPQSHVYGTPNTFTARLTAFNADLSDFDISTQQIFVDSIQPTAGFTVIPSSGDANDIFTFTASGLNFGHDGVYHWDFGDGSTLSTTSAFTTHQYAFSNIYNVGLEIFNDEADKSDTETKNITIIGANFIFDKQIGTSPLLVSFTDTSTVTITSFLWDFGDGETSTQQNPQHIYDDIGVFTVSLTADTFFVTKTDAIKVLPENPITENQIDNRLFDDSVYSIQGSTSGTIFKSGNLRSELNNSFTDNLKLYLPFEDNAIDLTGTVTTSSVNITGFGVGRNNKGFVEQNNNYVVIPDSSQLPMIGDLTISANVNLSTFSGSRMILAKCDIGNGESTIQFYIDGTGKLSSKIYINDIETVLGTTESISANNWTHVAMSKSSGEVKFYIDGLLSTTTVIPTGQLDSSTTSVSIGTQFVDGLPISTFSGILDDVAVWNEKKDATFMNDLAKNRGAIVPLLLIDDSRISQNNTINEIRKHLIDTDLSDVTWTSNTSGNLILENGVFKFLSNFNLYHDVEEPMGYTGTNATSSSSPTGFGIVDNEYWLNSKEKQMYISSNTTATSTTWIKTDAMLIGEITTDANNNIVQSEGVPTSYKKQSQAISVSSNNGYTYEHKMNRKPRRVKFLYRENNSFVFVELNNIQHSFDEQNITFYVPNPIDDFKTFDLGGVSAPNRTSGDIVLVII